MRKTIGEKSEKRTFRPQIDYYTSLLLIDIFSRNKSGYKDLKKVLDIYFHVRKARKERPKGIRIYLNSDFILTLASLLEKYRLPRFWWKSKTMKVRKERLKKMCWRYIHEKERRGAYRNPKYAFFRSQRVRTVREDEGIRGEVAETLETWGLAGVREKFDIWELKEAGYDKEFAEECGYSDEEIREAYGEDTDS